MMKKILNGKGLNNMLDIPSYILGKKAGGGEGGTSNYNELSNKPSINDVTLSGNKTTADLGIVIPSIATSISDTSTNTEVAGAKAVYDIIPKIKSVTLTPKSSGITIFANHSGAIELPEGKLVSIDASIRNVSISANSWRKYSRY